MNTEHGQGLAGREALAKQLEQHAHRGWVDTASLNIANYAPSMHSPSIFTALIYNVPKMWELNACTTVHVTAQLQV